jgi:hypothetical protein
VAGDYMKHQRVVGDGARQRTNMVEREGMRKDAAARDETVGRLEPDDAAGARRIAHAAAGIAAQCHREQACGHAGTRSRGRATGVMIRVPRIARRRPWEIEAGAADREFVSRKFAEHDCAGAAQTRHANRVSHGNIVGQDLRMAGRRQASDIDDVFDADRHAMQGSVHAAPDNLGFRSLGRGHCGVPVEVNEDVQLRIEPANPFQQRSHQFNRRKLPGGDGAGRLDGSHPVQVVHSPAPARIGGQGSARGSVGAFSPAIDLLACSAAAATSSGNSASAFFRKFGECLLQAGATRQQLYRCFVHDARILAVDADARFRSTGTPEPL